MQTFKFQVLNYKFKYSNGKCQIAIHIFRNFISRCQFKFVWFTKLSSKLKNLYLPFKIILLYHEKHIHICIVFNVYIARTNRGKRINRGNWMVARKDEEDEETGLISRINHIAHCYPIALITGSAWLTFTTQESRPKATSERELCS